MKKGQLKSLTLPACLRDIILNVEETRLFREPRNKSEGVGVTTTTPSQINFKFKIMNKNRRRNKTRKLQIGVMGSAADTEYTKLVEEIAQGVGEEIARSGNITVYGAEKDTDSLSTAAARGAKKLLKLSLKSYLETGLIRSFKRIIVSGLIVFLIC